MHGAGWEAGEGRTRSLASQSPRGLQGSPPGGLRRAHHLGCPVTHWWKPDPWDVDPLVLSLHNSQQSEEVPRKSPGCCCRKMLQSAEQGPTIPPSHLWGERQGFGAPYGFTQLCDCCQRPLQ